MAVEIASGYESVGTGFSLGEVELIVKESVQGSIDIIPISAAKQQCENYGI